MGGHGSTRWRSVATRASTADLPGLDVRRLHRSGQITPRTAGLEVRLDGAPAPARVAVAWTPCRFGGARPWLVCATCRRRRARLYLHGGCWLDCRACLDLAYATTRWDVADRRLEVLYRIHRRMGGSGGLFAAPPRPRGMHRTTYERLRSAFFAAKIAYLGGALRAEDERLRRAGWGPPAWEDGLISGESVEGKSNRRRAASGVPDRAKVRGVAGGTAGGRG